MEKHSLRGEYVTMESNTVKNPMHNFMKLENSPGLTLFTAGAELILG